MARKVIHIDFPPVFRKNSAKSPSGSGVSLSASDSAPPALDQDSFKASGRERIPPPLDLHDFLPDLITENKKREGKEFKMRSDVKPLHVVQPEGVSFTMHGNEITWQKWRMHVGEWYFCLGWR